MKRLKYFLAFLAPALVYSSLAERDIWSFKAVVILFGLLPLIELFTAGSTKNLTEAEEEMVKKDLFYDLLLYSMVPIQYFLLGYFLFNIGDPSLSMVAKIGMTTAFGMSCGILGINSAHELGHRSTWHEKLMSKMLLLTALYMHFFIEHNRGHHKNVSTEHDPASSRRGETVYAFYVRTITGSWMSAWHLERDRLKKIETPFWSLHNEMLQYQIIQLAFLGIIYWFLGGEVLVFFIVSALIGCLLLETVNYIEHYGLRRKKVDNRYERTMPIHSWNSNHPVGRLILFELSRHSDHHYLANRKYQTLRHFDESPQMPTGYPGMMVLAMFPPLWFYVMHRQIDKYKASLGGEALA